MTDLEGVAGVINGSDWLCPTGRYYEVARRLLTQEVNAAIRAFAKFFLHQGLLGMRLAILAFT